MNRNREDIVKKVEESNGKWRPTKDIDFVSSGGEDGTQGGLHALISVGDETFTFWCMAHHHDFTESIIWGNVELSKTSKLYEASKKLASFIGLNLESGEVVEVPITEESAENPGKGYGTEPTTNEAKLGGMVEAYEKILINREVTISR